MIDAVLAAYVSNLKAQEMANQQAWAYDIRADTLYGYSSLDAARNAYPRPKLFPRSEEAQDYIMIRRLNVRKQIAYEKLWKRTAAVIFTPIALILIVQLWRLSIEWMLQ